MSILNNFYIEDNVIHLCKRKITVRDYKTLEKTDYTDSVYYVGDADYREWTQQLIPKHQLLELVGDEEIDTSVYTWMDGITLTSDNHAKEIEEIAACGSIEAYEASLAETRDEYLLDLECRVSAIELGI